MGDRAPLTRDDVAEVADLALLNLSDDDLDRFAGQLDAVLDLASKLDQFDVADVPPTAHPFGLVNVFRGDVVANDATEGSTDGVSSGVREEALAAGPDIESDQFKVPPALGESP